MAVHSTTKICNRLDTPYLPCSRWKVFRGVLCASFLGAAFGAFCYVPQVLHKLRSESLRLDPPYVQSVPPSQASAHENLWTNPAAVDKSWTLEIEWDHRLLPRIQNLLLDPSNAKRYASFLSFFQDPEVANFVNEYGLTCNPKQHLYTWIFDNAKSTGSGYASCINVALSNFVLAYEPKARATHRFQFVQHGWRYAFLPNFFKDLGGAVNCSFFLDGDRFLTSGRPVYPEKYLLVSGRLYVQEEDVIMLHNSASWNVMIHVFAQLARHDGIDKIFKKKSVMAKAVWHPLKGFEDLLFLLWHRLVTPTGRYIGIHIRRGDKVNVEMEDIPLLSFVQKLRELCPVPCPHKIFVMTDEDLSYQTILSLTTGVFQIVNLHRLVEELGVPAQEYVVSSPDHFVRRIPQQDRRFWTTLTKQLVTEITLLAMAEQIVCTMTSNICRLAALLKGSYNGSVHSLDVDWNPE